MEAEPNNNFTPNSNPLSIDRPSSKNALENSCITSTLSKVISGENFINQVCQIGFTSLMSSVVSPLNVHNLEQVPLVNRRLSHQWTNFFDMNRLSTSEALSAMGEILC